MRQFLGTIGIIAVLGGVPTVATGQMASVHSPLQHNGASFYEYSHVGWSIQNPHYFIHFGGAANPPFGGFQPNAGLNGGFAVGNSHFDFGLGQGAALTNVSSTSVLTMTNGYPASMFIGSERPFVTGMVPVVGGGGGFASVPAGPLQSRIATGQLKQDGRRITAPGLDAAGIPPAPEPAVGVRALARQIPAAQQVPAPAPAPAPSGQSALKADLSASDYLERGIAAERDGRPGVARIYYQLAATKGNPVIKAQAARKLDGLK